MTWQVPPARTLLAPNDRLGIGTIAADAGPRRPSEWLVAVVGIRGPVLPHLEPTELPIDA
ncbi:hypothetical protein GCM10009641_47050 [Mycobacterium cookii]|uniref:Uncharacterized protein n=1 Tax=Nocardioides furvisabuli TaxID=375542 RepID=A0ABP5JB51_9ACTN